MIEAKLAQSRQSTHNPVSAETSMNQLCVSQKCQNAVRKSEHLDQFLLQTTTVGRECSTSTSSQSAPKSLVSDKPGVITFFSSSTILSY